MMTRNHVYNRGEKNIRANLLDQGAYLQVVLVDGREIGRTNFIYGVVEDPAYLLKGKVVADAKAGIVDWLGNVPLPYMPVILTINDEHEQLLLGPVTTTTDAEGNYKIFVDESDLEQIKNVGAAQGNLFPLKVELTIQYEYHRNDINYFNIHLKREEDPNGIVPELSLLVEITERGMEYDIDILQWIVDPHVKLNTPSFADGSPNRNYVHFTPVYYHTHEAVEFALTQLNMGHELEGLTVEVGGSRGTHYDSSDRTVRIDMTDLHYTSLNRPKNREYHEYAHHIQFIQWEGWPSGWFLQNFPRVEAGFTPPEPGAEHVASRWILRKWHNQHGYTTIYDSGITTTNLTSFIFPAFYQNMTPLSYDQLTATGWGFYWDVIQYDSREPDYQSLTRYEDIPLTDPPVKATFESHAGYLNASTADSFIEGSAEYLSLMMAKYREHDPSPDPHILPSWGSMLQFYQPWDKQGMAEEFSVCGILLRLYYLYGIQGMWDILKVKRGNFHEYYKVFRESHPADSEVIDAIFKTHGFYADQRVGTGAYEPGEAHPGVLSDPPRLWQANEYFVDMGISIVLDDHEIPWSRYDVGDKIGQAANYERPWRYTFWNHPQSFIRVSDTEIRRYRVKVAYAEDSRDPFLSQEGSANLTGTVHFPPLEDYEYLTDLRSGVISVGLPPANRKANITIIPESRDFIAENIYRIDNQTAHQKMYRSTAGYFDEHTFNLRPTGSSLDPPHELIGGVEPKHPSAPAESAPLPPQPAQPLGSLEIGERVLDSSWGWEHRTGPDTWDGPPYSGPGVSRPITWIVVAKDHYGSGSGITVMAEELIGRFPFDTGGQFGENHWGQSGTHQEGEYGLRPWLNSTGRFSGTGLYASFSEDFKNTILTTSVPNRAWEDGSNYITQDKVFIPSATELGYTRHEFTHPIGQVYPYFAGITDTGRAARLGGDSDWYWTRSPDLEFSGYGAIVSSTGAIVYDFVDDSTVGVRPVLNLDPATLVSTTPDALGRYAIGVQGRPGTHAVTFRDHDGTLLKTMQVDPGGRAVPPADPVREGHVFIGWSASLENITGDLTVTARYAAVPEGLSDREWLTSFYVAYWGRAADPGGMDYWLFLIAEGVLDVPAVAENFALSAEAKAIYPYFYAPETATDAERAEFLLAVYRNLLNREVPVDDAGVVYWVGELREGRTTPGAVIGNIIYAAIQLNSTDWLTIWHKILVAEHFTRRFEATGRTWTNADLDLARQAPLGVTDDPDTVETGKARVEELLP